MSALRRITTRLRDERGIALVMALGIITVLTVVGTTLAYYATTNYGSSARSRQDQSAFALAEAGLNNAYGTLSASGVNPLTSTLLPTRTTTYDKGTVTWGGSLDQSTGTWTVTSTGTLSNPTGPSAANVTRTLVAKIPVNGEVIQGLTNPIWNWMYATNTNTTGACDEVLASSSSVKSPLYVAGNLCFNNGATMTGSTMKLVVKGNVTMANTTNYVGQNGSPVAEIHTLGSCKVGTTTHATCSQGASTTGDQMWSTVFDHVAPPMNVPSISWDTYYANANPGPKFGCYAAKSSSPSSTWPVFDNDTTRNTSVATSFDLTPPTTDYNCWTAGGQLAWNHTTKILTTNGTIFIDGSAKATSPIALVSGMGTLYLSGSFILISGAKICGKLNGPVSTATGCDFTTLPQNGGWNPDDGPMLTIISNSNGSGNGAQTGVTSGQSIVLTNNSQFQGGLYGIAAIVFASSVSDQGPVVAGTIQINGTVYTYQFTITKVQSGMPFQNPTVFAEPLPPQYSGG